MSMRKGTGTWTGTRTAEVLLAALVRRIGPAQVAWELAHLRVLVLAPSGPACVLPLVDNIIVHGRAAHQHLACMYMYERD